MGEAKASRVNDQGSFWKLFLVMSRPYEIKTSELPGVKILNYEW
jgi:hypothetical protein